MKASDRQVMVNGESVTVWKVDNDVNGNPRFVVHYLAVADDYDAAVYKIHAIGGAKYRANWFGGGLVFSTYGDIGKDIEQAKNA